jgi:hypothetical protein
VSARVSVPLERRTAVATSYAAEVDGVSAAAPRLLVWSERRAGESDANAAVLGALARSLGPRGSPFVFVDFDPSIDRRGNARQLRDALGDRPIGLVIVLGSLTGGSLRFTTPYGDLIPAFDTYARAAGAPYQTTRTTAKIDELSDIAPFIDLKTIVIASTDGTRDLRGDASAVIGYVAGRLARGAEELPR